MRHILVAKLSRKKLSRKSLLKISEFEKQIGDAIINSKVVSKLKEKAKPVITTDQMNKAKEYVTAGGSVEAIKKKYKLKPAFYQELLKIKEINGQKAKDTKKVKK